MRLPLLGDTNFFSKSLRFNLELIFFRKLLFYHSSVIGARLSILCVIFTGGPWSPFENNWHLKEEFRRSTNRTELSQKLSKYILWASIINFVLSPIMFIFAVIFCVFSYGDVCSYRQYLFARENILTFFLPFQLIKRDPGVLGIRCWSQYGMLYMRHFNELDHELQARLNRAYRPAVKYMESFSSPMGAVLARFVIHDPSISYRTAHEINSTKYCVLGNSRSYSAVCQQLFCCCLSSLTRILHTLNTFCKWSLFARCWQSWPGIFP